MRDQIRVTGRRPWEPVDAGDYPSGDTNTLNTLAGIISHRRTVRLRSTLSNVESPEDGEDVHYECALLT